MKDGDEWVTLDVDRFIRKSELSILLEIEGDEYWVAKSQIDNLDDILKHMAHPTSDSAKVDEVEVPKWLAVDNGWIEEDD